MPRHHYIPQFYLKGFVDPATPDGHEPYLWIHEPGQGWTKRAPENAAAMTGYYAVLDEEGNESEALEEMLSQIESIAAGILRDPILTERSLAVRDRAEFAVFLSLMLARIPSEVEHVRAALAAFGRGTASTLAEASVRHPEGLRAYLERAARETGNPELATLTTEELNPDHYIITGSRIGAVLLAFKAALPISAYLTCMGWTLLISRSAGDFITSDYPMGLVDPVAQTATAGVATRTVEVSLPLSPRMALVMGWFGPLSNRWCLADESMVEQVNRRTALRARQLLASNTAFPGTSRILEDRTAPLELQLGPEVTHLPDRIGFQYALHLPPVVPRDLTWLRSLLPHRAAARSADGSEQRDLAESHSGGR